MRSAWNSISRRWLAWGTFRSSLAWVFGALAALSAIASTARAQGNNVDFAETIAPILEQRCVRCHQGAHPKGGLDLTTAKRAAAGGESGPAVVPGKPADSLLLEFVIGDKPAMPKDGPPLQPDQITALRNWIAAGAAWPEGQTLADKRVIDTHWWSLEPLVRPAVPKVDSAWIRTPVDAFVLSAIEAHGLAPAPAADRRTLIRRLYFDLLGLPPEPEEVDAFAADPDPQAYEQLVDRLLSSPRYGERWARHWLDVVHYGESHGYDKDQPRPNAWPYRDYVIRAFNTDKPYARFIEEQVAGDVLYPGTVDGVEALGFIAAGPWDLIGHAEVSEAKIDGKIARHLDRDDMITTTMNALVSLTVQCAQCHDHKFDPISQEDYYGLQAVFAALDRADKSYDDDPQVMTRRADLTAQQRALKGREQAVEARLKRLAGPRLAELDRRIAESRRAKSSVQGVEFGYHSAVANNPLAEKWVQVDLGTSVPLARIVYTACYDDFNQIGAGFCFPLRYKVEASDDPAFRSGAQTIVDHTGQDVGNPGIEPQESKPAGIAGRYLRFTATKLAARQNDYAFALAELAVYDADGNNMAFKRPVIALDSIEGGPRWSKKNVVDGLAPSTLGGTMGNIGALSAERQELLDKAVDEPTRREQQAVAQGLAAIDAQLAKLPPAKTVYAGTIHYGASAFVGTGASGGKPRKICILPRGDVRNPGREVEPCALTRLTVLPGRFGLSAEQAEGDRRAALARWLSDPRNPLTWRSIVNRVWLYHFGRGLVDTPNDFGRMGQLPSHPQLLDWLAVEFRDGGQSLKSLHRLLLTSATYRQSSSISPAAASADAQNAWYSHMPRRRLEAEAIRDSILAVSGKLDLKMYGPSFRDFVIEQPAHSPHYQYHLHDPEDPASHRRSIYRFIIRSQQQPYLATLDCADPSLLVDKRNQTITPLQALALLNNQLSVAMARHFAERVSQSHVDLPGQLTAAIRLALGRSPSSEELAGLVDYAQQYGLANACRVILNLNEFVFVD